MLPITLKVLVLFSSPELAEGELLELMNVCRTLSSLKL
jgi:hypothetical protein